MLLPIILAGGSGSRLWPLSRKMHAKQFLPLMTEHTLIQETYDRLLGMPISNCLVLCNEEQRFLVADQLRSRLEEQDAPSLSILLEPVARDTAPAITLAALFARELEEDPVILIMPADHVLKNKDDFHDVVKRGYIEAEKGNIVTFGIVPTKAETGYGYIQKGESYTGQQFKVQSFVEKPDIATAKRYLESGDYLWNSGMFMFRSSVFLEEIGKYDPEILEVCKQTIASRKSDAFNLVRFDEALFSQSLAKSIDYAVMERTDKAVVLSLDTPWSDLGSWSSIWESCNRDKKGNAYKGDVILENTKNSCVYSDSRLVATVGLKDTVIVETKDAVLVASKSQSQDVKQIVNFLKENERSEYKLHREVYKPWGKYDSLDRGDRFQVKRITVNPGAKLSVQMHHHRAEHWIVVSGTAEVTCGDKIFLLSENESTYIPLGEVHALANPGKVPLELIEVQSGTYFGEDDIIRLEDQYGRPEKETMLV